MSVALLALLLTRPLPAQAPQTSAEMYRAWCAVCHADDGSGRPPNRPVKTDPLDFSDCRRATPETDADWTAVIVRGGPAAGRSSEMPAFEVLTADRVQALVAYLRTLCLDKRWPSGRLNFPRPLFTAKAFPESEATLAPMLSHGESSYPRVRLTSAYSVRIGRRAEVEVQLPAETVGWVGGRHTGPGDIEFGAKRVLFASETRRLIATAGIDVSLPTGSLAWESGEGTTVFEPFIAIGAGWRGWFVQGQVKSLLPVHPLPLEPVRRVGYSLAVHRPLSILPGGWTLGAELNGVDTAVGIVPQISRGLTRTGALTATFGVRVPITAPSPFASDLTRWLLAIVWDYTEPVRPRR